MASRSQLFVAQFSDALHHVKVVEDHSFAAGRGVPPASDHLFRNVALSGRTFELARSDGLFDEWADEVAIASFRVGDRLSHADVSARVLRDLLGHAQYFVWQRVTKRIAVDVDQ
ncbi:hypothetical protein GCM10027445_47210 [Amycolatopsis endophytica]